AVARALLSTLCPCTTLFRSKGALEEMLAVCTFAQLEADLVVPLDEKVVEQVRQDVDEYNEKGLRVLLLAQKTNPSPVGMFSVARSEEHTSELQSRENLVCRL